MPADPDQPPMDSWTSDVTGNLGNWATHQTNPADPANPAHQLDLPGMPGMPDLPGMPGPAWAAPPTIVATEPHPGPHPMNLPWPHVPPGPAS
jgi:hypothetical protein